MTKLSLCLSLALLGCVVDDLELETTEQGVTSGNRLATNRLATNRLATNRLATNSLGAAALTSSALIETADGREVFTYIVKCALPTGTSVTLQYAGVSYTFAGEIGLAPKWATTTPTVSERRWVTACLLARANLYGVEVPISMRGSHAALATTKTETTQYYLVEGAFYGDLFDTTNQSWYACGNSRFTVAEEVHPVRACTISEDNVTTMCGFSYAFLCGSPFDATHPAACATTRAPFGKCKGGTTTFAEVITVFLKTN